MAEENHLELKSTENDCEGTKKIQNEEIKIPALAEKNSDDGTELCNDTVENTDTEDIGKQEQNEMKDTTETNKKEKKLARSEKKRKRYEEQRQQKKEDRKRKKTERKERENKDGRESSADGGMKSKRELKEEIRQKCELALEIGQKICIDCSLEGYMSTKEKGKLAMQVGRLYGSNRQSDKPAHIYLTGLKKDGELYQELVRINDGFTRYLIDTEEKSHTELFPLDKIIVLSPDSDTVLQDIEPDKVYIIGGLVDENVTKNVTASRASEVKVCTARLPIDEYMVKIDQPSHSKILAVNQVFDILLSYISTQSWKTALANGVPRRKGFIVKEHDT